jgi:hypothetical protein
MWNNIINFFHGELLAPHPTPNPDHHPLWAVRDCLFNIFAATLHIWRPFLPPPATWAHTMPWWQGPIYHSKQAWVSWKSA